MMNRIINRSNRIEVKLDELKNEYYILKPFHDTDAYSYQGYNIAFSCIHRTSGIKTYISLNNIELDFDIRHVNNVYSKNIKKSTYDYLNSNYLTNTLLTKDIKGLNIVELRPFKGYFDKKQKYLRLSFNTLKSYSDFLKKCSQDTYIKNLVSQDEEPSSYYRKYIHFNNIKQCPSNATPKEYIVLMTWDIETYASNRTNMSQSNIREDEIFLICGTFHQYNKAIPKLGYVISTKKLNKNMLIDNKEYPLVIFDECKTEKKVLHSFINILKKYSPDIITGFNDFGFDWKYVKNRIVLFYPELMLELYEALNFSQRNKDEIHSSDILFKTTTIKLSAEDSSDSVYPKSNHITFIDTQVQLRKLYPKESRYSLNHFLNLHNMENKEDMKYSKLFDIFENDNDIDGMATAASYCLTDALRCQELLIKTGIVDEAMKTAEISNITLEDALTRGVGYRILHAILEYGIPLEYSFQYRNANNYENDDINDIDNNNNNDDNYQGGKVLDTNFGLHCKYPIVGLDFSSLYPSIIRTYNLSHDMIIKPNDLKNYNYHTIKLSNETIYVLDHKNNDSDTGLLPKILADLFNKRKILKDQLGLLKKNVEETNNHDIITQMNDIDQKQKAVKVLMNSIYGVMGSSKSGPTLFEKCLAEAVTYFGRCLIEVASNKIKELGYVVYYGDTDSCYLSLPHDSFKDEENEYIQQQQSKEALKILIDKKVNKTKKQVLVLQKQINEYLSEYTKYNYLKMSYEEVLYPIFFVAKKVYLGIEHVHKTNDIDIDKYLFVRGYSIVKRNVTGLTIKVIRDTLIRRLLSYEAIHEAHNTVNGNTSNFVFNIIQNVLLNVVLDFRYNKFPIDLFIKNDRYSANKNNIKSHTFVKRMEDFSKKITDTDLKCKYRPPESGHRFDYIYVEKNDIITPEGKCIKITKIGDIMEYPSFISDFPGSKLAYMSYFESELSNEFARLIEKDSKKARRYISKIFEELYIAEDPVITSINLFKLSMDDVIDNKKLNYMIRKKEDTKKLHEIKKNFKETKNFAYESLIETKLINNLIKDFDILFNHKNYFDTIILYINKKKSDYNKYFINKKHLINLFNISNLSTSYLETKFNKIINAEKFNIDILIKENTSLFDTLVNLLYSVSTGCDDNSIINTYVYDNKNIIIQLTKSIEILYNGLYILSYIKKS